ncbi:MAG: hypothetical protein LBH37_04360 [Oscillospiraceae bacterium]|jgi:nucleotide sugar dehydrogenase|nr:hypothetical protein [Oscillospiraceae bacterium]
MDVLIVGYGNIGKHIYKEFASLNPKIYDPNISDYNEYPTTKIDVAFICVPTDALPDGSCDISIVEESVKNIEASVLVIKSTVPVGTTEMLAKKYQKNLVFSPEYYGTTKHSSDSPNFLVLGGNIDDCKKVAQVFYRVKNGSFKINYTTSKTAELAKYMENCFLALKVTFCNEFAAVAANYDISYEMLREIFIMDERMGDSHTFVYDGQPFYDSHCLNKDIPAFLHVAKGNAPLINTMHEINQSKIHKHKK